MKFEIVPAEKAVALRRAFIQQFVDTVSEHYQKHIATLIRYTDGLYYDGYLWECLLDNDTYQKACSMEDAAAFLREKKQVYVMWDLFSGERVKDHRRFSLEYPKDTILNVPGNQFAQTVMEEWNREQTAWESGCLCQDLWLPEDLYCFDETMKWCAVFTHEGWDSWTNPELDENAYIRICFFSTR